MAGHRQHHGGAQQHRARADPVSHTVEMRDVDPDDILSYAYVLRHRIMHHQAKQGIVNPLLSKQRQAAQQQPHSKTLSSSSLSSSPKASRSIDFTPSISNSDPNGEGATAPWQSLDDLSCLSASPLEPPRKQLTARSRKQPGQVNPAATHGTTSTTSTYSVTTVPLGGRRRQQQGRGCYGGRSGPGTRRRRCSLTASWHLSPQGTPHASRRCSLPAILEQDSGSEEDRAVIHRSTPTMAAHAGDDDAAVMTAPASLAATPMSTTPGSTTPLPMRAAHTDTSAYLATEDHEDDEEEEEEEAFGFGFGPAFGFGELASRLDQVVSDREQEQQEKQQQQQQQQWEQGHTTSTVPCLALSQGESSLPHLMKQSEWQPGRPRYRQTTAKPRALGTGPLFGGPVPRSSSKRRSRHVRNRSWPSEPSALFGGSGPKASHLASPSLASIPQAEEGEENEDDEDRVEEKQGVRQQQHSQRQDVDKAEAAEHEEDTASQREPEVPAKEPPPMPTPPSTAAGNKAVQLTRWRRFSNLPAVPLSPCYEASEEFALPKNSGSGHQ